MRVARASQRDVDALFVLVDGQAFMPHVRGGGLVSLTASVAPNVFVGADARVEDEAIVTGVYSIVDRAVIGGRARISGNGKISDDARIDGDAVLSGSMRVSHVAHISGHVVLEGFLQIECGATIDGDTHIRGNFLITG